MRWLVCGICAGWLTACPGVEGGPTSGSFDSHCAGIAPGAFTAEGCEAPTGDALSFDGGVAARYGVQGYDDECKYAVQYLVNPIRRDGDTSFSVTFSPLTPVSDAGELSSTLTLEARLGDEHVLNTEGVKVIERLPGTFTAGPVRFDAAGMWTVSFNLYPSCQRGAASPYAHISFLVKVP